MKRGFRNLWSRTSPRLSPETPTCVPKPAEPFLAIGDLHGRFDLLANLVEKIPDSHKSESLVFLGDYVDRGEDTKKLLKLLMTITGYEDTSIICLRGNHEQMLLDFIDDPQRHALFWLHNGGLQTLASFGVAPSRNMTQDPLALDDLRDELVQTMGQSMIEWLRALPLTWQSGNVWTVHAGADPRVPMQEQAADVLLWGHHAFRHQSRQDGQWVVHGHSIVDTPTIKDGRIALDTGAYATGLLTAAAITAKGTTFYQTDDA